MISNDYSLIIIHYTVNLFKAYVTIKITSNDKKQ